MSRELMTWLGKQAAHFILPPKKRSVQTQTFRPGEDNEEPEKTTAVQSPHRYGRKVTTRPASTSATAAE